MSILINTLAPDAARAETPAHFPERFASWLARCDVTVPVSVALWPEVETAVRMASLSLPIADVDDVRRIHDRNAGAFRLLRSGEGLSRSPMLAHLPLNAAGLAAIVDGRLDALRPDPVCIAGPDEPLAAVYPWLLFAPGMFSGGVRLIADVCGPALRDGAPVFARPVNRTSARILEGMGSVAAASLFPSAPAGLQVALPTASPSRPGSADIEVRVARSMDDLLRVFSVRTSAFMADQRTGYEEEFDGNDFVGTHLLATVGGEPAACARIRYFGAFAKFERFAVVSDLRRSAVMGRLARACIEHVRRKGFRLVYAHARADLVPVWARFGARPLGRPPFRFSDIDFHELVLELEPDGSCLGLNTDPMVLNRPEGAWSELGPIDRAQLRPPTGRREFLEREIRRFDR